MTMNTFFRVILLLALSAAVPVLAGNLTPPREPGAGSSMPTTKAIFQQLSSGTVPATPGVFQGPSAGPTAGTGRTLAEIQGKLPEPDNTNGAAVTDVLSGKSFWGLRTDGTWGLKTGSVAAGSDVTGANGSLSINIPDGLYSGGKSATATDGNLSAGNIKSGTMIFGVSGTVIQATGTAVAGNVLNGTTFSNSGAAGISGMMPDNGVASFTPGAAAVPVAAGYYSGGQVNTDANLTASNITAGITIFGVSGTAFKHVNKTGQTTSYATGDDGYYRYGVKPAIEPTVEIYNTTVSPSWTGARFTDNGDGTVTDNITALVWLKNANCTETVGGVAKTSGFLNWSKALTWSNALYGGTPAAPGPCGLKDSSKAGDWRLPNINELQSLGPTWPPGTPFTSVQGFNYWSSSSSNDSNLAWVVGMGYGGVNYDGKSYSGYVWPVRSGQ